MPTQSEKAEAFRALHQGPGAFVIPNPWDAGSARILHALGYKALATTSAGYAFSLGVRDGAVGRDRMLAHCREMVNATPLPVSADLENCYGDAPEAVAETVRFAAAVGLAGCSVEDSTGHPDAPIYDFNLAVERVAAAVEAARSLPFPFTLTARAENFLQGRADLEDTVKRLRAFAQAGAGVVYAPAVPGIDAIETVVKAVAPVPVNVLVGRKNTPLTVATLSERGVRRISVGSNFYAAAMGEFMRAAKESLEQGTFSWSNAAAAYPELTRYMAT